VFLRNDVEAEKRAIVIAGAPRTEDLI